MMRQYELVDRVRRYNPHTDEELLNRAYVYAMRAHGQQKRASGDPYFTHPLEVAAILTELRLDDATIVAAVLHDTIEDTGATKAEIDSLFGPEIGSLVDGLTKLKKLDLVSKRAAQAENFRKLLLAISEDVRVLLVKLADRLHNMRTLHYVSAEKRARIAEETLDIYAPLAGRMGMQNLRDELENLSFKYLMPEAFAMVSTRLEDLRESNRELIRTIEEELTEELALRGIEAEVRGRQKQPYSVWSKMERKSLAFEQLSDIFGFRVVVGDADECYRVIGVVHTKWPMVPGRFKDYISTPKQNDYRSIHTTVVGPGRQRVELQVRTRDMHDIACFGIAAHALYKDGREAPAPALSHESNAYLWLKRTIDMLAEGSSPEEFLGAHPAGAVPRPGVLLHPQGPADRVAARRDADRFRLRRPHQRRQFGGGRQDQRASRAFARAAGQWRRGRDRARGGADAAGRLGVDRGDRQGPRGDPARQPRRRARPICRPGAPDRAARLRTRRQEILRGEIAPGAAAPRALQHRGRSRGGRARGNVFGRRGQGGLSRIQGGAEGACPRPFRARLVPDAEGARGGVQVAGRGGRRRCRSAASRATCR